MRKPGLPGDRFVAHIVAGSQLYVALCEQQRLGRLLLREYKSEPAAWWPNGRGGWLKPDAYVVVSNGRIDHLWWVEVDRATESIATIRRKLHIYLAFVQQGQPGPRGTVPLVLVTVPDTRRQTAVAALIQQLPPLAAELCHVVLHGNAADWLAAQLPAIEAVSTVDNSTVTEGTG